jgi:hypothetical protein
MTTDIDPNRARTDEVAQLRREIAELRRELDGRLHLLDVLVDDIRRNVRYLFRDTERLDRIHHKLRRTIHETTQRVALTGAKLSQTILETTLRMDRQDRELDNHASRADDWLATLHMWVDYLAAHAWPKMDAFHHDLRRLFPKGVGVVPNSRLPKKKPASG